MQERVVAFHSRLDLFIGLQDFIRHGCPPSQRQHTLGHEVFPRQCAGALSSRLLKILEGGALRPDKVFAEKATAVEELSRLFTKGRQALGTDYLKDPVLAGAYL